MLKNLTEKYIAERDLLPVAEIEIRKFAQWLAVEELKKQPPEVQRLFEHLQKTAAKKRKNR